MPSYTDEQLLQILRDLAAELGRSPSVQEQNAATPRSYHVTNVRRSRDKTQPLLNDLPTLVLLSLPRRR
jgi:hypothetical protein